MALLASGSALVAGSVLETSMQTRHVRVVRAFYFNGEPTKVGAIVEVPSVFGAELIASKKAEAADPPAKPGTVGKSAGEHASKDAKGGSDAR